jgi:hypothetical protein
MGGNRTGATPSSDRLARAFAHFMSKRLIFCWCVRPLIEKE